MQIQRACHAACGRIVGPADVSRGRSKSRTIFYGKGGEADGSSYERNQTFPVRFHRPGRRRGREPGDQGNQVTKSYVYSNIKPNAEPAKILAVGKALGGLFDNDITGLVVVERSTLTEE